MAGLAEPRLTPAAAGPSPFGNGKGGGMDRERPALEVEGLSYAYTRAVRALDGVAFDAARGPVRGAPRAQRGRQDDLLALVTRLFSAAEGRGSPVCGQLEGAEPRPWPPWASCSSASRSTSTSASSRTCATPPLAPGIPARARARADRRGRRPASG